MKGDVKFNNGILYYEGDNGQYYPLRIGGGGSKTIINNIPATEQFSVEINRSGIGVFSVTPYGGTPSDYLWSTKTKIFFEWSFTNLIGSPVKVITPLFTGGVTTVTTPTATILSPSDPAYPTPPALGENNIAGLVTVKVTDTLGRVAFGYWWEYKSVAG